MEIRQIFKRKQKQEPKKKEVRIVLRSDRQIIIKNLMKKCVGRQNAVTHDKLFETVYGDMDNYSELQIFFLWHRIKQDMNWLRKTTPYFIGVDVSNQNWYYYIVTNERDAEPYIRLMTNNIKKCEMMRERCKKAVREKWYERL
jgi:hypothetical protein